MRSRLCLSLLLPLFVLLMQPASAQTDDGAATAPRAEIPIHRRMLSNGETRFYVKVQVGAHTAMDAMFDTGSTGLRILASAIDAADYRESGYVRAYGYGSGVVYRGPLADTTISVDTVSLPKPIPIQVIRDVTCSAAKPNCPAARVTAAQYRIGGDGLPGEGFPAIFGASLRSSAAPSAANNPLAAYPAQRWIVSLPRPGDSAPGTLILNPRDDEVAAFRPVASLSAGADAGGDAAPGVLIAACVDRPLDEQRGCPPMMLDSGAANGIAPFYAYRVLYDLTRRRIALQARR